MGKASTKEIRNKNFFVLVNHYSILKYSFNYAAVKFYRTGPNIFRLTLEAVVGALGEVLPGTEPTTTHIHVGIRFIFLSLSKPRYSRPLIFNLMLQTRFPLNANALYQKEFCPKNEKKFRVFSAKKQKMDSKCIKFFRWSLFVCFKLRENKLFFHHNNVNNVVSEEESRNIRYKLLLSKVSKHFLWGQGHLKS